MGGVYNFKKKRRRGCSTRRSKQNAELYNLVPNHDPVKASYCEYYGRLAPEPEHLFQLLFLQILYNLSDERVIADTQVNLAYKWFTGLNPEDPLPDPTHSRAMFFYFDIEKCKVCPLRDGCYKPNAKAKTYSIRIVAEHYKEHMEFEQSDTFKSRIRRRPPLLNTRTRNLRDTMV
jgi:Transposase domain (DUF772)